jgi:hypothetical protein
VLRMRDEVSKEESSFSEEKEAKRLLSNTFEWLQPSNPNG